MHGSAFSKRYELIRRGLILELKHQEDLALSVPDCDDAFHDGSDVLPAVLEWHDHLRNSARRADTLTWRVLDLVDKELLVANPEHRLN